VAGNFVNHNILIDLIGVVSILSSWRPTDAHAGGIEVAVILCKVAGQVAGSFMNHSTPEQSNVAGILCKAAGQVAGNFVNHKT
jgi:hypothetical protein